ncbi:hypothetical protein [Bosea beijingensis]|uniref:hypothetical protein n=1 Tax=Bosea beijingensis TaxID=3068632 RepID=UPI0027418A89|nr:hypothetical protein [Bosea sp. REN20]
MGGDVEVLILGLVVGSAVYILLKTNTMRGAEAVRAHIYLGGMEAGVSKAEANFVANIDAAEIPTEIIIQTKQRIQQQYGSKQLPMIADAYRAGMVPKLPTWQRMLMGF